MLPLRFADGFGTTARVYTFDGLADGREHLALGVAAGGGVCGSGGPAADPDPSECFTGDVLGSERCDCGPQLLEAVRRIAQVGAAPALPAPGGPRIGLYAKLDAYGLQDGGRDTYDANLALGYSEDGRDYTVEAQMLGALGLDPGSPAEQQPGQGSPCWTGSESPSLSGCRPRCISTRSTLATWPQGRQRRTHAGPPVR